MPIEITLETILIFTAFLITVFVLYKLFKIIIRASLVVVASFAFPWVAQYIGLPISANIETGILFAIVGFGLFLVYEFFHFIVHIFKIITWPFRRKK